MKALNHYVAQANVMRKLFKQPLFDLDSGLSRKMIAGKISSDLSPENLTCDGELSRAQINKRYNKLTKAAEQLEQLDPTAVVEV